MIVSREVSFNARHSHHGMLFEPNHNHEFTVRISIEDAPNSEGFVCDFRALKRIFKRVIGTQVEGRNLDMLFEFPTSENLAKWIWNKLDAFFPLHSIEIREKPHSRAIYYGPDVEPVHK